jgi:hypothetical protein
MSRKTRISSDSSTSSATAWAVEPAPSRLVAVWYAAVHALAAASFLASGLDWPIKLAGVTAVVTHAVLRRRPSPTRIARLADGTWSLPALGYERLTLRPGTAVGPFWVKVVLGGPGAKPLTVLLVKDQLDPASWRRLQAELRRAR